MSKVTTFAYDLNGNLVVKGVANGMTEKRTHDARNRVSTLENVAVGGGSDVSAYAYQYDAAGNVMQVAETYPGGSLEDRTITNTYDGVYRLTNEEIATTGGDTVATGYAYDKGHNRLTKAVTGGSDAGTTTCLIGNGSNGAGANQIISATLPDSSVVDFAYDANGNRITRSAGGNTDEYSYDYENRLVSLDYETGESGTGMYAYGYDYRTRRVARTEPGVETIQMVFVGGVSIEEFGSKGASNPSVEYVRGHDYGGGVGGLEYSVRNGHFSFNQFDSRGDVVGKTDASGAITYQAAYEAFGEHPTESGSTEDRQKANTKEEDPTGLLNEGFRYRDLETGTFITRDPLGFKAGPNVYTYVHQNPWTRFDPEGLDANDDKDKFHPPANKEWKAAFPDKTVRKAQREFLDMSTGAYDAKGNLPKEEYQSHWHPATTEELRKFRLDNVQFSDAKTGFSSQLYFNSDTGKAALAFRGTQGISDMKAWQSSIPQAFGVTSAQYRSAVDTARQVANSLGAQNVTMTGHSLGGGLAAIASLATQAKGVTFNAQALSNDTIRRFQLSGKNANALITAFHIGGEPLSTVQGFAAHTMSPSVMFGTFGIVHPQGQPQGQRIRLDSTSSLPRAIMNPVARHLTGEFLQSMQP